MSDVERGSFDPVWEDVFRKQEWGRYPPEHVVRNVARSFYKAPDRGAVRVLDLGSGPGACAWFLAREGFRVAAIDGSPTAIAKLEDRFEKEHLAVEAVVGDIVRLPWFDAAFDGVVETSALNCNTFAFCKQIIAEVLRVLKPGGLFVSTNFTDRTWGYGLGEGRGPGEFTGIREGPLADKGLCLFMGRSQVGELYAPFAERTVDVVSWTLDGMAHTIEMWMVVARKGR